VKDSPLHGRGVFAVKNLSRGALIEEAPAVFLSKEETEMFRHSMLFNYYYLVNDPNCPAVFGFGFSSFYNHSSRSNAFYEFDPKRRSIRFYAYRRIMAGDEITINYNGRPNDDVPVYFPEES